MEQSSQQENSNFTYPSQENQQGALTSITSLLKEVQNLLPVLRREFRGEALQQYPDGSHTYIQISKPYFVRVNFETNEPLRQTVRYRIQKGDEWETIETEIYVANDEAIEEVLSMLKSMGLNQITLLTNLDENTILDDLKEFECKLAAVLMLKQKEWGIDKELLPMIQTKFKTIVQDARYLACNGNTIKTIQKTVQRIEQAWEGEKHGAFKSTPYA